MTGYDKVRKGYKWEVLALLWVAYLLNQAEYRFMMGIIEFIQLAVLAVHGQSVLCQVVGAYAEEIHFFRQFTTDHNRCRCLNHNAEFHIILKRDSLVFKLFFHLCNDGFNFMNFRN